MARFRIIAIFVLVMSLCGTALAGKYEELTFDKVREIFLKRGIEISGRTLGSKELLEMEKLKIEMEAAKTMMEQAKARAEKERVGVAGELADEAKRWDLKKEDVDLIVALYYANWAIYPMETDKARFSMGDSSIAFVSFYAMLRKFYDTGRPIKTKDSFSIETKTLASEYPTFLDYYIAYLERKKMNYPKNLKEVTELFLPRKKIGGPKK